MRAGTTARPELLSLLIDHTPASYTHELDEHHELVAVEEVDHVRI